MLKEWTFSREIRIYVLGVLSEEDREDLRRTWEGIHGEGTFDYSADGEYAIEFLTDDPLEESAIADLKENYGIRADD